MFPEILGDDPITLDNIYKICKLKYKEHIIYSRVIFDFENLEKAKRIMDLSNPMLGKEEEEYILTQIKDLPYELNSSIFLKFYKQDGLENILKNINYWMQDIWVPIDKYNKTKINTQTN